MSKKNPNECHIVLRPNMKPEDISALMPAQIEIADVLKYTDKSSKLLFPDGCLSSQLTTIRTLSYAIMTAVKDLGITWIHRKEHLEDGSIVITYQMPIK